MRVLSIFCLLLVTVQIDGQTTDDVNAAMARARKFFRLRPRQLIIDTKWIQNSAKIGAGYDTVTGSPVCYSGHCQMEGFRQSIFKLHMTKTPEGTCTDKLIPQHVELVCLPSTQVTANTETITTLDQLRESTKRGIDFAASVGAAGNSFSYGYSHETRSMIDTIIQSNSTVCFTRATITSMRLTAFVPLLELSDQFRYVIEDMPCCNASIELDQYIREYVIGYFGLAYVRDLLLGGFAQQKIIITEESRKKLEENGFTTTNRAELNVAAGDIFSASAKLAVSEKYDKSKLSTFTKFTQQSSVITLGGATHMQSIEEWSKTVPSNPTIVKFGIASILDLLTTRRFPGDTNIARKRALIQSAQEKYSANPLFCYNNCSQRGSCEPSGFFGFGTCRCQPGSSGIDCSIVERAPTGLLIRASPNDTCPSGYALNLFNMRGFNSVNMEVFKSFNAGNLWARFRNMFFKACSLTEENTAVGPQGTFCGIVYRDLTVLCNNLNPHSEPCPSNYSNYSWPHPRYPNVVFYTCQKNSDTLNDNSGTLCGFNPATEQPVLCDGYHPGFRKCPPGYTSRIANGDRYFSSVFLCSKN